MRKLLMKVISAAVWIALLIIAIALLVTGSIFAILFLALLIVYLFIRHQYRKLLIKRQRRGFYPDVDLDVDELLSFMRGRDINSASDIAAAMSDLREIIEGQMRAEAEEALGDIYKDFTSEVENQGGVEPVARGRKCGKVPDSLCPGHFGPGQCDEIEIIN